MATKIRPIVFKIDEPDGFVMNASNAIYIPKENTIYVAWKSPSYPDEYNGDGKQYVLVNNNTTVPNIDVLVYGGENGATGPNAISSGMKTLGTSTGVLLNNVAIGYGFGSYLIWPNPVQGATLEQAQAYIANVTITILDP